MGAKARRAACSLAEAGRLLQIDYIKDEQRHLKREMLRAQEEVKRIQSVPLVIGQFLVRRHRRARKRTWPRGETAG